MSIALSANARDREATRAAGRQGKRRIRRLGLAAALLLVVAEGRAGAQEAPAPPASAPGRRAIVPPKLVTFVQAEFPPSEVAAGRGAVVVLQVAIDAAGKVAGVAVLESAGPAFDAAAVDAAKQFFFQPATVDGHPIPVKITYRYQFTLTEKLIKKQLADFQGTVLDRATKRPIEGIGVALDTGQETVTDSQGKFRILDIPPGDHAVTLSGEGIATVGTTETFGVSKNVDATYEVEKKKEKSGSDDEEEEVVITAPRLKKQVVSTEVQATQAQKVAGTQGDVLKVVENLPGVARAAVGSSALVVWGAAPQDTRVYVDGIHVPLLYHGGGYRSILPSNFVKSVELIPGGYGPAFGRGLGGIVAITLRALDDDGIHGSIGADAIDASVDLRAKIGDRVHIAVGARKSYLDGVLNGVSSEDVGSIVPIPRFWDGQARIVYDLGPHETIEVGGLTSSDRIDHTLLNPAPSLTTRKKEGTDFTRVYARYEKHLEDSSIVTVVPSVGVDSTSIANTYGPTLTNVTNDSLFLALRATWQGPVTDHLRASLGLDAEAAVGTLHRSGSIGAPPREGDVFVFGQPPPGGIGFDDWKTVIGTFAPYVEGELSLFEDRLQVIPGLRFEPFITSTNKSVPTFPGLPDVGTIREEAVVEPRISMHYAFSPRISAKAAFGEYHQSPQPEDLSAVFGTPTLVLSGAKHYLAGGTFQLTDALSFEVTAFLSESEDLVVRSQADTPYIAHALDQTGIGRSIGTQFLVRQEQMGRFFGWISYSILRSTRRDAPNLDWRVFDYDQSHVFTAVGSYDLGAGFEIGARFRYATGYPRTPVVGSYLDTRTDTHEPIFGLHNTTRVPSFVALDVRGAKHFKWGRVDGEIYLDVQNVTNHSNPEEIVYNTNYTQRGYITGMPILPVLGARLSW
jgi:TonB family protein